MKIIVRTLFGADLQERLLLGLPFVLTPYTSLNEKFNVQGGVLPNPGDAPRQRYFCIGNGGHRNVVGADSFPLTSPIEHSPDDAALYKHMPFLLRDPSNDLDVTTRAKYALRVPIVIKGANYIAYYLKRLDMAGIAPSLLQNHVVDGVTTSTPFVPTSANLNPTQPDIASTGVVTTSGDYLSTSAVLPLNFTAADVAEYVNVANIMFGSDLYAVISEIGLVSGADKIVTGPGPGNTQLTYTEVVCAQINTHISGHYPLGSSNQGFSFGIELGATEPLTGATSITTGP